MQHARRTIFAPTLAGLLAGCLLLAATACDPASTPQPGGGPATAPSVELTAAPLPANADPLAADPLADSLWRNASWVDLSPPLGKTPAAPPARVAALWTADTLYLVVIAADPAAADRFEVFLDTTKRDDNTEEMLAIGVGIDGAVKTRWYRATSTPKPRADGSPDFAFPILELPDYPIAGLQARVGGSTAGGKQMATVVLGIPLKNLPTPLRPPTVQAGQRWRINVLRSRPGPNPPAAGMHLSPIVPGSQPVAPYRMAELVLSGSSVSAVAAGMLAR